MFNTSLTLQDGEHNALPFVSVSQVPGSNWKCTTISVTPQIASTLLEKNVGNRPVRKQLVGRYVATMREGNWKTTPEGIIIAEDGTILDGQHRLLAIEKNNEPQTMFIMLDVEKELFPALNRGAGRSASDALQLPKKATEVGRLLARVTDGASLVATQNVTDERIRETTELILDIHEDLMNYCATTTQVYSSAPFRAAACVRILGGYDETYVKECYRNLILARLALLPPYPQTVVSHYMKKKNTTKGDEQSETLARAWNTYDQEKANVRRCVVSSNGRELNEITTIMRNALEGSS